MLTASASSSLSSGNVLVSLVGAIVVAAVGISLYLSKRTESLRTMQDSTITALQGSVTSLEADGARKDGEIKTLTAENKALHEQLEALRRTVTDLTEQVKQVAKVDALTKEVRAGFASVNDNLRRLNQQRP